MYGKTGAAAIALPNTGFVLGWYVALALGVLFLGMGLMQISRRRSGVRP